MWTAAGAPIDFSCGDNNPFYILADGSVQEGGAIPAGMSALHNAVSSMSYVVSDLTVVRDFSVSFD